MSGDPFQMGRLVRVAHFLMFIALLLFGDGVSEAYGQSSDPAPTEEAIPPCFSQHLRHVFFDNSSSQVAYYHSRGSLVAPSEFELRSDKVPVVSTHFRSPPNGLRLRWRSAPGGDWRATIQVMTRYGRRTEFSGNSLALWCFSEEGLRADDSPRLELIDASGSGLPSIRLLAQHGPLEAGKWVQIRLSVDDFKAPFGSTEDREFDLAQLARIDFVQGMDDGKRHTLYVDDIHVLPDPQEPIPNPEPPLNLKVIGQERHFDLSWDSSTGPEPLGYRVERSWDGVDFTPVATRPGDSRRCVDFVAQPNSIAHYRVIAWDRKGQESSPSESVSAKTRDFSDDELLSMIQQGCFRYYWEASHDPSGMALEIVPGDRNLLATGASGFGVMALLVAAEREFVSRDDAAERMLKIVRFLKTADRFHGAWPHFLYPEGRVNPYFGKYDNGGDLVETAFLIQGLLAARQYFTRDTPTESEIRATITTLWREVEWDWYRQAPESDFLFWHWSPDHAWQIQHPLVGWNETMIVYLLAIASPTHGVPGSLYYSGWAGQSPRAVEYRRNWSRSFAGDHYSNGQEYYGIKLDVGSGTGGELFFTQFSFLGFDPRGLRDRYTNYFENNRALARIQHAYCIDNPRNFAGYGPACWGRSAGINSGGGKALPRDDNGTICPSAALGAFPYTPEESLAALKHFYRQLGDRIWGVYGFHDGFNESEQWFDEVYMGLNQAQIVVGIENHRSGLVWRLFMANPEVQPMLTAIGFQRATK